MTKRPQAARPGKRDSALCKYCDEIAAPGYPVCQKHKSKLTTADRLYLEQQREKSRQPRTEGT